jgi:hypothetical protein
VTKPSVFFALLCLALLPPLPAFAGPNANGTLVAHDAEVSISNTNGAYCALGVIPPDCESVDTRIDGATSAETAALFRVYAAFPTFSSPRLTGIDWGVHYDDTQLVLRTWSMRRLPAQ